MIGTNVPPNHLRIIKMKWIVCFSAMFWLAHAHGQDIDEGNPKEIIERMNKMLYVEPPATRTPPAEQQTSPYPLKMETTESPKLSTADDDAAGLEACHMHGIYKLIANGMYDCEKLLKDEQERNLAQIRESQRNQQTPSATVSSISSTNPMDDSRVQGLKSGTIKVNNLRDAEVKFNASNGRSLITNPKIKPDGKNYSIDGFLEKYTSTTFIATFVPAQVIGSMPFNTRFVVLVPPAFQASYQNTARVGVGLRLVGKYVGNKDLPLVTGASVTVPVFEMLYLD